MVDTAGIFGQFTGMFKGFNPLVWIVVILAVIGVTFGFLFLRKRKKLTFPAAEIVDLGSGKTSFNFLGRKGAGWFGKKRAFFNLWDYGDEIIRTNKGEIVEQFSEEDFQEVNGKRGIIFYRDPIRRLLFPINKLKVVNKDLVSAIAPAEYTDTGVEIIKANIKETKDKWAELAPYVALGLMAILLVISIVVITQMIGHSQDKANQLILDGGKNCLEMAKSFYNTLGAPSTAP